MISSYSISELEHVRCKIGNTETTLNNVIVECGPFGRRTANEVISSLISGDDKFTEIFEGCFQRVDKIIVDCGGSTRHPMTLKWSVYDTVRHESLRNILQYDRRFYICLGQCKFVDGYLNIIRNNPEFNLLSTPDVNDLLVININGENVPCDQCIRFGSIAVQM